MKRKRLTMSILVVIIATIVLAISMMYNSGVLSNKESTSLEDNIKKEKEILNTVKVEEDKILEELKRGDFSRFEGIYIPDDKDSNIYGGGEKLNDLILDKEGKISGGGMRALDSDPYPYEKPKEVLKNKDGSYLCMINENITFSIYPKGKIENNEYIGEKRKYLKDKVYIHCILKDGGVMDVVYYIDDDKHDNNLNKKESEIKNYDGVDWVDVNIFSDETGSTFISGLGIEYTVVNMEINNESSRETVVIEDKNGNEYTIYNIPGFQVDSETGILYYNIYKK